MFLCCSEYSSIFDGMWPLSSEHQHILVANTHSLLQYLAVDQDLTGKMAAAQCVTWKQLEIIMNTANMDERIRKLLRLMSRRSVHHFNKFIECVRNTQNHLVALLVENAGIVCLCCMLTYSRWPQPSGNCSTDWNEIFCTSLHRRGFQICKIWLPSDK